MKTYDCKAQIYYYMQPNDVIDIRCKINSSCHCEARKEFLKYCNDKKKSFEKVINISIKEIRIKKCPFCGGEAELYGYKDIEDIFNISCTKCGAAPYSGKKYETILKLWNSRKI